MTGVLVGETQRETHREQGQVRTQAETGVALPQVQGHPGPPGAEEAEPAHGQFQASGLCNWGRVNYHPVCGHLLQQPQETVHISSVIFCCVYSYFRLLLLLGFFC